MHGNEPGRIVPLSFLFLISYLCGCGGVELKNTNTLSVSPNPITFGAVTVGQIATANVSVQNRGLAAVAVSQLNTSSASFSTAVQSALPITIAPGATYNLTVKFAPTTAGAANGQLELVTNQSGGSTAAISLAGSGTPAVTSLACNLSSVSGSGTDVCKVTLNVPAASGGLVVNLTSSDSAVSMPASVTVPANATTVQFNATVSTVSSAQSATLTASASGSSSTFAVQLVPNGSVLTFNSTSISFGSTALNIPVTQTLQVTAAGTLPVSITSAVLSGTGFTIVGATFPITLNPAQSATLNVQFNPKSLGAASGQLNLSSTALTNSSAAVSLSGTGVAYEVQLAWNPPTDTSDPVAGYKVYRSTAGSSAYQLLNSATETDTAYIDTTVQSGTAYNYMVESVDTSGTVSQPSNATTVTIP